MINLGNKELNQLPEETKAHISKIIMAYYRFCPNTIVAGIILFGVYFNMLDQVLTDLSTLQPLCATTSPDVIFKKLEAYLQDTMELDKRLMSWGVSPERWPRVVGRELRQTGWIIADRGGN